MTYLQQWPVRLHSLWFLRATVAFTFIKVQYLYNLEVLVIACDFIFMFYTTPQHCYDTFKYELCCESNTINRIIHYHEMGHSP